MTRNSKRRLLKPAAAGRARWYASRGYPHSFIAEKLGVHRNTVRSWCDTAGSNSRSLDRLVTRLRGLPPEQLHTLMVRVGVLVP